MSEDNTKFGYMLSTVLHIGVAVAVITATLVAALFHREDTEPPKPFEMVEPPPMAQIQNEPVQTPQSLPKIKQLKVEKIDPINLPEPQPEEPTPPEPKPEPTPPEPQKEEPAPSPKPSKKPLKKIEEPKHTQSYKDFLKKNPNRKSATIQRKPTTTKPVVAPTISANTSHLDSVATISGTVGESSATKAALASYLQLINSMAKRNWVAPESTLGMTFTAKVLFSVSKNGLISGVRIITASGNSDFDRSVVTALNSLTIPPPPDNRARTVTLIFQTE